MSTFSELVSFSKDRDKKTTESIYYTEQHSRNSQTVVWQNLIIKGDASMRRYVADKYLITSNAKQFILNRKMIVQKGDRAGTEYIQPVAYYPRLSQLIVALIELDVRQADICKLQEMDDRMQELAELIESSFIAHFDTTKPQFEA